MRKIFDKMFTKKNFVFGLGVAVFFVLASVVISCDGFVLPKKLAVKLDNSEYEIEIAANLLDLSKILTAEELQKEINKNQSDGPVTDEPGKDATSKVTIFDYEIGDGIKHYVLIFDAADAKLDVREPLEKANALKKEAEKWDWISDETSFDLQISELNKQFTKFWEFDLEMNITEFLKENLEDQQLANFLSGFEFGDITSYLYTYKSMDVFPTIQISGAIYGSGTNDGNTSSGKKEYFFGTEDKKEPMIVTLKPFDENHLGNLSKRTDISKIDDSLLSDIINGNVNVAEVHYNLQIEKKNADGTAEEKLTVTKADFEKLAEEPLHITSKIIVDIPILFVATKENTLEIMELDALKSAGDILGRSNGTDALKEYTELVKNFTLGIGPTNAAIFSEDIEMEITDGVSATEVFGSQAMPLRDCKFVITGSNVDNLLATVPYKPALTLSCPEKSSIAFPADCKIGLKLTTTLIADGKYVLVGDK